MKRFAGFPRVYREYPFEVKIMKKYILTLDEGTTSARAILFDQNGKAVSVAQYEFKQIFPKPSFVEHNPEDIFDAQMRSVYGAVDNANIPLDEIAAIGITNQRETTVVWEKATGKPVYNAIVWQCRRTADICEKLIADGYEEYIKNTTGLPIDAYFSGTKIKWILDNVDGAREKAEKGKLLFGTVDTYLMWKLSNGKIHATDYTNASRTMLFDIHRLCWDEKLLELLSIPKSMLPEVYPSGYNFGFAEIRDKKIPICGVAGDQQSALFGQKCFSSGDIKNTYGTGCFLLMNTGDTAVKSENGLVTTLGATLSGEPASYVLEGSVFIGGAVIQWLRDELNLIKSAGESEELARKVKDSNGVYIVPAFSGLGAPYWNMYATGVIAGLTRGSNKNHIVRAALDSIAYQTNDLITAMEADAGIKVKSIRADGGAARNKLLMQFQSDISDTEVSVPEDSEATALGACFIAGITCGFFKDRNDVLNKNDNYTVFAPNMSKDTRKTLLKGWERAVKSVKAFSEKG